MKSDKPMAQPKSIRGLSEFSSNLLTASLIDCDHGTVYFPACPTPPQAAPGDCDIPVENHVERHHTVPALQGHTLVHVNEETRLRNSEKMEIKKEPMVVMDYQEILNIFAVLATLVGAAGLGFTFTKGFESDWAPLVGVALMVSSTAAIWIHHFYVFHRLGKAYTMREATDEDMVALPVTPQEPKCKTLKQYKKDSRSCIIAVLSAHLGAGGLGANVGVRYGNGDPWVVVAGTALGFAVASLATIFISVFRYFGRRGKACTMRKATDENTVALQIESKDVPKSQSNYEESGQHAGEIGQQSADEVISSESLITDQGRLPKVEFS